MMRSLLFVIALFSFLNACAPSEIDPVRPYGTNSGDKKTDSIVGVIYFCDGYRSDTSCRSSHVSGKYIGIISDIPVIEISIYYSVQEEDLGPVTFIITDTNTNEIIRHITDMPGTHGHHSFMWNGKDDNDQLVLGSYYTVQALLSNQEKIGCHKVSVLKPLPKNGGPGIAGELPGFYHHLGTDAENTDNWGHPWVIETLIEVGQLWKGPARIGYGDISIQNGGDFSPHTTHKEGLDVDMRYASCREAPVLVNGATNRNNYCYDQSWTEQLITLFYEAGAIRVIIYDTNIVSDEINSLEVWRYEENSATEEKELQLMTFVVGMSSHYNHMHVDFPDNFPVDACSL